MLKIKYPPIIIIGMHRSGTSLVTRILDELGLYVGWPLDPNHEATFFIEQNEGIMRLAGATWANPAPVFPFLQNPETSELLDTITRYQFETGAPSGYFDQRKKIRLTKGHRVDFRWGWKDPRNSFTLPLWLRLFPDASVIHVLRNGVDVAASLTARRRKQLDLARELMSKGKFAGFSLDIAERCATLESAFALWEEYVEQCISQLEKHGRNSTEIKFEKILENPHQAISFLGDFCGLPYSQGLIEKIINKINGGRQLAFQRSEQLRSFEETRRSTLRRFGY